MTIQQAAELLEQGATQCNGEGERLRIDHTDLLSYQQRQRMLSGQAQDLKIG